VSNFNIGVLELTHVIQELARQDRI